MQFHRDLQPQFYQTNRYLSKKQMEPNSFNYPQTQYQNAVVPRQQQLSYYNSPNRQIKIPSNHLIHFQLEGSTTTTSTSNHYSNIQFLSSSNSPSNINFDPSSLAKVTVKKLNGRNKIPSSDLTPINLNFGGEIEQKESQENNFLSKQTNRNTRISSTCYSSFVSPNNLNKCSDIKFTTSKQIEYPYEAYPANQQTKIDLFDPILSLNCSNQSIINQNRNISSPKNNSQQRISLNSPKLHYNKQANKIPQNNYLCISTHIEPEMHLFDKQLLNSKQIEEKLWKEKQNESIVNLSEIAIANNEVPSEFSAIEIPTNPSIFSLESPPKQKRITKNNFKDSATILMDFHKQSKEIQGNSLTPSEKQANQYFIPIQSNLSEKPITSISEYQHYQDPQVKSQIHNRTPKIQFNKQKIPELYGQQYQPLKKEQAFHITEEEIKNSQAGKIIFQVKRKVPKQESKKINSNLVNDLNSQLQQSQQQQTQHQRNTLKLNGLPFSECSTKQSRFDFNNYQYNYPSEQQQPKLLQNQSQTTYISTGIISNQIPESIQSYSNITPKSAPKKSHINSSDQQLKQLYSHQFKDNQFQIQIPQINPDGRGTNVLYENNIGIHHKRRNSDYMIKQKNEQQDQQIKLSSRNSHANEMNSNKQLSNINGMNQIFYEYNPRQSEVILRQQQEIDKQKNVNELIQQKLMKIEANFNEFKQNSLAIVEQNRNLKNKISMLQNSLSNMSGLEYNQLIFEENANAFDLEIKDLKRQLKLTNSIFHPFNRYHRSPNH